MKIQRFDFYWSIVTALIAIIVAASVAFFFSSCKYVTFVYYQQPQEAEMPSKIVIEDEFAEYSPLTFGGVYDPQHIEINDTTNCPHTLMISTMMSCDNPPFNNCTCIDCGYSFKCN